MSGGCDIEVTDRTIHALLDLQDDLNQVTLWLLDNWRSDWPAPELHYHPSGAEHVVDVSVPCLDPTKFAEIAQALGIPPIIRPASGPVVVCKTFGRVGIEAFTTRAPEHQP